MTRHPAPLSAVTADRQSSGWFAHNGTTLLMGLAVLTLLLVGTLTIFSNSEPEHSFSMAQLRCGVMNPDPQPVTLDPTTLPHAWLNERPHQMVQCRLTLSLTLDEIHNAALYIPSYTDALKLRANGASIAALDLYAMRDLRFITLPAFIDLGGDVLQIGENVIDIMLTARPGRPVSLSQFYLGPRDSLRWAYQQQWFIAAVLPTVAAGCALAFAIVFGAIWLNRRSESAYGWMGLVLFLGALRGSVLIPDFGMLTLLPNDLSLWNMLAHWESFAAILFARSISGTRGPIPPWALAIPPALLWIPVFTGITHNLHVLSVKIGAAWLFLSIVLMMGFLAVGTWRGRRDCMILFLSLLAMLVFGVHDLLLIWNDLPARIYLGRVGYTGVVMAMAIMMTIRFITALNAADRTAATLRSEVAAARAELGATYEELRIRREAELVERERGRLMRDLHDGMGGELVTILALSDRLGGNGHDIAGHARAALTDMRLIIGSLEDFGGDLPLALGVWRERVEPQLRAANKQLGWDIGDLPTIDGLGPAQLLDIMRILQEALTNAIRHSGGDRVQLRASRTEDGGVTLTITDNGKAQRRTDSGGPLPRNGQGGGHGITNMTSRANRLGGSLSVIRGEQGGTTVTLSLPTTLNGG